jgi:hypothetical protein
MPHCGPRDTPGVIEEGNAGIKRAIDVALNLL